MNFLVDKPLINDSLFGRAVDIHIVSGLLVTWSDFSFLKFGLSDVNILVIPDTSVDLVRLSFSDLNNDSLALCNFDDFWVSLKLGNQLWISLSDLRNPELFFSWIELRRSVVRVAVVTRDKSVLRLVVVRLIIGLVPLNRFSVKILLVIWLSLRSSARVSILLNVCLVWLLYLLIAVSSAIRLIRMLLVRSLDILLHYKNSNFSFFNFYFF